MEQENDQTNTVNVPTDVFQTLLAEIAHLRKESSETKILLTSVQEKLNTVLESINRNCKVFRYRFHHSKGEVRLACGRGMDGGGYPGIFRG